MGVSIPCQFFFELIAASQLLHKVEQDLEGFLVADELQKTHIVLKFEIDDFLFRYFTVFKPIKVVVFYVFSNLIHTRLIVIHVAGGSRLPNNNLHDFIRLFVLWWRWAHMAAVVHGMARSRKRGL
jgi:hypothetical protein